MKPLLLGMPSLLEAPEPETCAALCRELGFDFVELNMNLPQCQYSALDADKLRSLAIKNRIFFTLHLDEKLDPCDFNPHVVQAWTASVFEAAELATKIGAPLLNMHLHDGVYFTLPGKKSFLYESYCEDYLRAIRTFRDDCEKKLSGTSLKICVENTRWKPFQRAAVNLLLESPAFALTWDVGHDAAAGGLDGGFILSHADRLSHIHIHDVLGRQDHMTLGGGKLDLKSRLLTASEHGCRCVIEVKTADALRKSATWLKREKWI